jgi:uncharacterized protein (TIRG00374 family)
VHLGRGERYLGLLRTARPEWLLATLVLQTATYLCAALVWQRALACQGKHDSLSHLTTLGLAKTFMDQAIPSAGLSGTMLVARALRHRGVPNRNAVATVLAGLVAFYLANAVAALAALTILWSTGRVNRLVTTAATGFAVVVSVIPAVILWLTSRPRTDFPRWVRRIRALRSLLAALGERPPRVMRAPRFLVEATALQLAIILLDAASLGALLYAVGWTVSPRAVFTAFTMGAMVATVSPLPGGLGTFDGTVIAMLRAFQIPLEPAVAATVLFRVFALFLPLVPGFWLARRQAR